NLITTDNDWSGVPGITGYSPDRPSMTTAVDPQTLLDEIPTVNVSANQTNVQATLNGVVEFHLADPVVALQGAGNHDSPNLVITVSTLGSGNIHITCNLRDLDDSADNAAQQVALQYRVGTSGNYTNIPAGYVADASTGPNLATLVTPVSAYLPAAAD